MSIASHIEDTVISELNFKSTCDFQNSFIKELSIDQLQELYEHATQFSHLPNFEEDFIYQGLLMSAFYERSQKFKFIHKFSKNIGFALNINLVLRIIEVANFNYTIFQILIKTNLFNEEMVHNVLSNYLSHSISVKNAKCFTKNIDLILSPIDFNPKNFFQFSKDNKSFNRYIYHFTILPQKTCSFFDFLELYDKKHIFYSNLNHFKKHIPDYKIKSAEALHKQLLLRDKLTLF